MPGLRQKLQSRTDDLVPVRDIWYENKVVRDRRTPTCLNVGKNTKLSLSC
ncbi:Uncharacterized protein APZ42_007583 [Daphnia magna]|uniref:Uncharacterized protein n=1 Tax=Daphnia magna TaxID=35525 RepID=A0A164F7J3_9CRUS|nr:Uncharacterized protein APZ42_007583 [Daphnia magna]